MKVLILVLSCKTFPYDCFMQAQQATWAAVHHPNVDVKFYYGYDHGRHRGDEIPTDCSEDFYMMHWKHKLALDAVWDEDWDIIFRTNSSAYIDKARIYKKCLGLPLSGLYGGWLLGDTLPHIDWNGHNIKQKVISGAGIFYSRDIADVIRHNTPEGPSIEEDVLIGRTLYILGHRITFDDKSRCDLLPNFSNFDPEAYHYRIKSHDREQDIRNMYKLHSMINR